MEGDLCLHSLFQFDDQIVLVDIKAFGTRNQACICLCHAYMD